MNITADQLQKLNPEFYNRDTQLVARELLGKYLVRVVAGQEMIAKIVEVEAYLGVRDLGAHAARGRTQRTEIMFGPPGYAYVYLIYGMYYCLNFVTEPPGHACAVLIRAVEPIRNISAKTTGPGLLCKALQIDKRLNGCDLGAEDFYVAASAAEKKPVMVKRPRIGIDYAKHWTRRLLRFYIKGNAFISKP